MITAIIAILGGLIAASGLIVAKKPNAKELLDKLTPYQGWIGVVLAFWGLWDIISAILSIGQIGQLGLILWVIWLVLALVEFTVGFLLGYSLISKYILEKNETAKIKGETLRLKLVNYQVPAGIILILLGVLYIILAIIL